VIRNVPGQRAVVSIARGGTSHSSSDVRNTSSIFAKLAVAGRAEAIIRAREAGLGRAT
jgi:hypothetical protein